MIHEGVLDSPAPHVPHAADNVGLEPLVFIIGRLLIDPHHRPELGWLRLADGRIAEMGDGPPPRDAVPLVGGVDRFVAPGFIDAHMHLPQIRAIGCDGLALLDWLEQVIFPAELRWAESRQVSADLDLALRQLRRSGTLGAAAYSSPHTEAIAIVARRARASGIRLIAGQALMDRAAPEELIRESMWDWGREGGQEAAPTTMLGSSGPATADFGCFEPSVNPRFALSCSDQCLAAASTLAALSGCAVQTHLAESAIEVEAVRRLFPHDPSYTAVYDRHGLLGERTLLAHGVHLSAAEWSLIAARRSVVVHCPTANTFLRSGLFDLGAARAHGVRLALGSDLAAGCDLAMPRVARAMIEVAKLRQATLDPGAFVPTPAEAWRMITQGNAEALGWSDSGILRVGARADLLLLRPDEGVPDGRDGSFDEHLIGRLIYGWRDEWIERSFSACDGNQAEPA